MKNIKPLKTAVLFITYKRINTTKQVFDSIRKAKPLRLYISSNLGRDKKECRKVRLVRDFLEKNIDWDCEVKKLYRTEHLSARLSISSAIDWFFETEEMGIILEDDCVPDQSFFPFCTDMLERYHNITNIMQVAGFNLYGGKHQGQSDYIFSHFGWQWGWATWKRAWNYFDINMSSWLEFKKLGLHKHSPINFYHDRIYTFDKTYDKYNIDESKGNFDTWDYQWHFAIASNSGISIVPRNNLITNIGFGSEATHGVSPSGGKNYQISINPISFPLKHPKFLYPDLGFDKMMIQKVANNKPLYARLIRYMAYLKSQLKIKNRVNEI